jgi:type II secretory pathway component HofQ
VKKTTIIVAAVVCLFAISATAAEPVALTQANDQTVILDVSVIEVNLSRAEELESINKEKGRLNSLISEGKARPVTSVQLRAKSGESATTRVGQRIPIQTGGQAFADQSQIRYENTGLNIEAMPRILSTGQVEVRLSLELSLLDKSTGMFTPSFVQRTLKDTVRMRANETAVLLGVLQHESLWPIADQSKTKPPDHARGSFVVLLTARVVD